MILGNDQLGDCVIAGGYHIVAVATGNAGNLFTPTMDQIIADYGAIGGYVPGNESTDQGCDEIVALTYWQTHGFANGTKILGWLAVDPNSQAEIEAACWLFENVSICIELPNAWVSPMPNASGFVWDVAGDPVENNGHCIMGAGYSDSGILIDSWGLFGTLTFPAAAKYCAESANGSLYVILTPDIIAKASSKAANGFDIDTLIKDFNDLGGGVNPATAQQYMTTVSAVAHQAQQIHGTPQPNVIVALQAANPSAQLSNKEILSEVAHQTGQVHGAPQPNVMAGLKGVGPAPFPAPLQTALQAAYAPPTPAQAALLRERIRQSLASGRVPPVINTAAPWLNPTAPQPATPVIVTKSSYAGSKESRYMIIPSKHSALPVGKMRVPPKQTAHVPPFGSIPVQIMPSFSRVNQRKVTLKPEVKPNVKVIQQTIENFKAEEERGLALARAKSQFHSETPWDAAAQKAAAEKAPPKTAPKL
jgi:hypothetical protein